MGWVKVGNREKNEDISNSVNNKNNFLKKLMGILSRKKNNNANWLFSGNNKTAKKS